MNRICYPMTDVPEYLVGTATAPYGGVYAGDVLMCENLDNSIMLNFTQYRGEIPTPELLPNRALAIVISGGNFDRTPDGRMPKGQPDYTKYYYREGETVPVIFLEAKQLKLFISDDCLNGYANVGQYLTGLAYNKNLYVVNEASDASLTNLKVVAKHNFRLGGIFGGDFANGNICVVSNFGRS
jgi:hypothetical protein